MMTVDNRPDFFKALNAMGVMFCDELTETRQRLYWELLRDLVTIDEWRYACTQAMCREAFHKVPLPSQLLDYVKEYRAEHKRLEAAAQAHEEQEKYRIATEKRLALEASPEWQAEQAEQRERQRQEERHRQEEYNTWLASLSDEDKILYRIINPPRDGSRPFHRLTEEELHYIPTVDASTAHQKARAQLRQLMEGK